MKKIIALLALLMSAVAIGEPKSPCYWSGQFVKCFPTNGFSIVSGTASIPAIGFDSDNDGTGTGLYRAGTNSLGFTANGTLNASYDSAGLWTFVNGVKLNASATTLSAYEEGTWAPAEAAKNNLTGTGSYGTATYTRIGNRVTATIESISGYTVTVAALRTFLQITSTNLPGVTNTTQFYGFASGIGNTSGKQMPIGIQDVSVVSTTIQVEINSYAGSSPDALGLTSITIMYKI